MMQDYTQYVNIALRDTKDNTTQLNSHTHFFHKAVHVVGGTYKVSTILLSGL